MPKYQSKWDDEMASWIKQRDTWNRNNGKPEGYSYQEFTDDWNAGGPPPNFHYFHTWYDGPCTHYQIYETVSEGTPVSPVFETRKEMVEWLVGPDSDAWDSPLTRKQALAFVDLEYVPSALLVPGKGFVENYRTAEELDEEKKEEPS